MISAETIAGLEARKLEYLLGARERSDALVKTIVLANDDPFVPLLIERRSGKTQLFAKEVTVAGKRYIVCCNEAEAENDRKEREKIIAALDAQLKKGDKALIGNSAYRRYLRKTRETAHKPAFEIDAGKLAEEARFDGVFVLRTNARITPLQALLRYRDLLMGSMVAPGALATSPTGSAVTMVEPTVVVVRRPVVHRRMKNAFSAGVVGGRPRDYQVNRSSALLSLEFCPVRSPSEQPASTSWIWLAPETRAIRLT